MLRAAAPMRPDQHRPMLRQNRPSLSESNCQSGAASGPTTVREIDPSLPNPKAGWRGTLAFNQGLIDARAAPLPFRGKSKVNKKYTI